MASILVLGSTGYIGGMLVPRLLARGHRVRCLVRYPEKISGKGWSGVEIFAGDVLAADTLGAAFRDVEIVFYLVHSMASGEKGSQTRDRIAAQNVAKAAREAGVKRIIYLSALGSRGQTLSPHLQSRREAGEILRSSDIPVTEFRVAVIVGSGSAFFEMMHHLVNRLPVMICPRWIRVKTQPIGIADVLRYLVESVERPESAGRVLDIGGPQVLTYGDMMLTVAKVLGLKRSILPVPVLTPRLSSYWVNLITPIPIALARTLIESLRSETICENQDALQIFDFQPLSFEDVVRRAVARLQANEVETKWTAATSNEFQPAVDPSHLFTDQQIVQVDASQEELFRIISCIGGNTGWLYANWLWRLRGFIDKQLGGVGLRRGRRHPSQLSVGEALDFWRVEDYQPPRCLLLRAEMKVWGRAWMEFEVENAGARRSKLIQTARYYPKGLIGLLYWFSLYPLHWFVFRGMARAIGRAAEKKSPIGVPAGYAS